MENRLKRMKIEETPVDETLRAKTRRAACKTRPSMRWVKPVAISAVAVAMTAVMLLTLLPSIASQTQDGDIAAAQQSAAPAQVSDAPVMVAAAVSETTAVSTITLDINPSIQLTVEQGAVTAVQAFNDDGAAIVLVTDIIGMTPMDAVDALVAELVAQGYITQGEEAALVITVSGCENDGLAEELKDRVRERVREMDMACEVVSASVSPEDVEAAQALGMSVGRYLIIKYIAEQEGISLEDAIAAYGSTKMKNLLDMVDDPDAVFENDGAFEDFIATLTPEQQAILQAALDAYKTTVKDAHKAFIEAGKVAQKTFIADKKAAQDAFKETHDNDAWKAAKTALKEQFYNAKATAKAQAQAAKEAAKQTFLEAIAGLELTDEQIAQLTAFVFDFEWDEPDFDDMDIEDADDKDDKDNEGDEDNDDKDDAAGKDKDKDNPGKGHDKDNKDDDEDSEG